MELRPTFPLCLELLDSHHPCLCTFLLLPSPPPLLSSVHPISFSPQQYKREFSRYTTPISTLRLNEHTNVPTRAGGYGPSKTPWPTAHLPRPLPRQTSAPPRTGPVLFQPTRWHRSRQMMAATVVGTLGVAFIAAHRASLTCLTCRVRVLTTASTGSMAWRQIRPLQFPRFFQVGPQRRKRKPVLEHPPPAHPARASCGCLIGCLIHRRAKESERMADSILLSNVDRRGSVAVSASGPDQRGSRATGAHSMQPHPPSG